MLASPVRAPSATPLPLPQVKEPFQHPTDYRAGADVEAALGLESSQPGRYLLNRMLTLIACGLSLVLVNPADDPSKTGAK